MLFRLRQRFWKGTPRRETASPRGGSTFLHQGHGGRYWRRVSSMMQSRRGRKARPIRNAISRGSFPPRSWPRTFRGFHFIAGRPPPPAPPPGQGLAAPSPLTLLLRTKKKKKKKTVGCPGKMLDKQLRNGVFFSFFLCGCIPGLSALPGCSGKNPLVHPEAKISWSTCISQQIIRRCEPAAPRRQISPGLALFPLVAIRI